MNQHLVQLKEEVEQLSLLGGSDKWETEDFELLSKLIFKQTGTNVPTFALRKVWGHLRSPAKVQTSTLDVLSQYAGYANWKAFKQPPEASDSVTLLGMFRKMMVPCIVFISLLLLSIIWNSFIR